ncbi:hypothetical protein [Chenggangzhangella methanolivorans]|uniref:Uncharacterized protein n=2 Tax=Chenggangzhangella methanolivorans TaxID=1437009 RepID=A0A9E6R773_9HYPH|nr:hypothetical protein [Chenggangzhangella methanolivorans]QZN99482.1 hypothetical protein K6K41_22655 [Chenggangzhangella methanolivorans]
MPRGDDNASWISGLLARASQDDDGEGEAQLKPQSQTLEALDSLSVDIARMIDHQAVAELWDRYRRGERGVFTRRLYTLQGQQTYEDIKRKYAAEPEFRTTVDRYVAEFEKLLEEVAPKGSDDALAQTYLTSETGKVYTMLAHAAGKFEQR